MKTTHAFFIGHHRIQERGRVFIIAEAGVNHNQQLALALRMVDEAARAGADAIKFQTFQPKQVVIAGAKMAKYQAENTKGTKNQQEMLERVFLPENFYGPIMKRCKEKRILFLSTPHGSKVSVDFLETLNVPAYKIPSGDLTNYMLLDYIARTGKPIILSTGVAYMEEVKASVKRIRKKGKSNIVVLHCITNYPCPPDQANLRAISVLMDELDVPVGYSDHTQGDEAAIAACAMGIALYEFHFTLDRNMPGPDHSASSEPQEMRRKIAAIRRTETLMGNGKIKPVKEVRTSMRPLVLRSIVTSRALEKGHLLCADDLEAKRPGSGVTPKAYERFIGKKLKKNVPLDYQLSFSDVK